MLGCGRKPSIWVSRFSCSGLLWALIVGRGSSAWAGRCTPELSPKTLALLPSDIAVLLLDEDQKQSQWSGSHFLVDPVGVSNLMVWFRGDKYHRSWRDWQWATSKAPGHFNWTSVQLNYYFNINYQPIGAGGISPSGKR